MKKILLLISCLIISVATAFAATGQLNAYAYGASYAYDPETQTFAVNWSMQAEASAVRIVAVDTQGNKYVLKQYSTTPADAYNLTFSIWDAVDAVPTNEDLRVEIEVKTASRNGHEVIGRISSCSLIPYSIDVDDNPYSECFGLVYITHMNSTGERGIQVLDQWFADKGLKKDPGVSFGSDWWGSSRGVPHMVRVMPDSTGRLLVSSSSRDQETHLWLVEPNLDATNIPLLNDWKSVITSTQWKSSDWTNHGTYGKDDKMANASIDIRENGDYWDILLLATSFSSTTTNHAAGQAYSGVYRVAKSSSDLTGGSYIPYTAPIANYDDHPYIGDEYMGSTLTATANFDKYGGVFYNAHTEEETRDPNGAALIHRTTSGEFQKYTDGEYFKRKNLATKGVRFNQDFSKIAIAQGKYMTNELRIYDVSQSDGNSHPVLTNGVSVDLIGNSTAKAYIHDIAWDYAQNIYVTVRNSSSPNGLYVVATNLGNKAITTPVGGQPFQVVCPTDQSYTITLNQQGGTGTLTGAGTYASCTPVTVTATPDGSHKFLRWSEGGVEVSKEPSYTFYATKNRNLVAEFEYAVYNVEWYNLFEEGKDITTIGVDANDNNVNNRLWYLFLAALKETGATITDHGNVWQREDSKNAFWVVKTLQNVTSDALNNFLTNTESKFYWLGKYILDTTGETINYSSDWKYLLHLFFNRTKWCYNVNGGSNVNSYIEQQFNNNKIPDFTTTGHPDYWRKYWTRYACNLPMELSYDQSLPTDWTKIAKPSTYVTYEPTWYKWNNVWSPQNNGNNHTHILAWRFGSATGEIVNHVPSPEPGQESVKLYATYIKKHIHENDPDLDPNDKCDAKNSDVLKLLFNDHWDGAWHKITITRKLQAGMYNTICLPFNVNLETDLPADGSLDEAEFWQYDGTVSSTYNQSGEPVSVLNFTRVTDQLVAGTPYLVEVKKDVTNDLFFSGALDYDGKSVLCDTTLRPVIADPEAEVKINFIGTINPTTIPDGALILVANNRLASTTEPGRMEGMRGYFTIDPMWAAEIAEQAADGRVYLSMKKPATTSIPVAPEAEQQTKPEVRKIMRDGQIYILRGDEVYTITGAKVK